MTLTLLAPSAVNSAELKRQTPGNRPLDRGDKPRKGKGKPGKRKTIRLFRYYITADATPTVQVVRDAPKMTPELSKAIWAAMNAAKRDREEAMKAGLFDS